MSVKVQKNSGIRSKIVETLWLTHYLSTFKQLPSMSTEVNILFMRGCWWPDFAWVQSTLDFPSGCLNRHFAKKVA